MDESNGIPKVVYECKVRPPTENSSITRGHSVKPSTVKNVALSPRGKTSSIPKGNVVKTCMNT